MTRTRKQKPELTREQEWGFEGLMAIAAFRYCCGRQSYIVKACADWLIDVWPMLPDSVRAIIQRDLEEEFARDNEARARDQVYKPLGWDCDRQDWERVRKLWGAK